MKIALFPGSFDPLTLGHLDIIKSGAELFDKLVIGVAYNSNKKGLIQPDDRVSLIKEAAKDLKNVEVVSYKGMTADFANEVNANIILRGLRNSNDFEYEMEMGQINAKLNNKVKTVLLLPKPEYYFISSSVVKDIIANKGNLSDFVPPTVEKFLKSKFY